MVAWVIRGATCSSMENSIVLRQYRVYPEFEEYTKHVAVSFHHARSAVIQGEVDVKYVSTQLNVADIFTKPLVPILFKQHRKSLGVGTRLDY